MWLYTYKWCGGIPFDFIHTKIKIIKYIHRAHERTSCEWGGTVSAQWIICILKLCYGACCKPTVNAEHICGQIRNWCTHGVSRKRANLRAHTFLSFLTSVDDYYFSIYDATERPQPFDVGLKMWKMFDDVKLQPQRTTRHNWTKLKD